MQTEPELQMSMTDRKDALPAKHSPGEWAAEVHTLGGHTVWIRDENGREVVRWAGFDDDGAMPKQERIANARRIVQCVNAHDELVGALRAAKAELDYQRAGHIELRRIDRERLDHLARMAESAITNATQGEA
jgi:hypothetical protein